MREAEEVTVRKPRVFVGSSVQGKRVAGALQVGLSDVAEVIRWDQGVFGLSTGTLHAVVNAADDFDFAVLVLQQDDLRFKEGASQAVPRDNVLFELGLFMGRLGQDRTFIVYDLNKSPTLPTDLAGVTAATYSGWGGNDIFAEVGPACTLIAERIRHLKFRRSVRADGRGVAADHTEFISREELARRQSIRDVLRQCAPRSELLIVARTCVEWANLYHDLERALNEQHLRITIAIADPGLLPQQWMIIEDFGKVDVEPALKKFRHIVPSADSEGSLEVFYLPSSVLLSFVAYATADGLENGVLDIGADRSVMDRHVMLVSGSVGEPGPLLEALRSVHAKVTVAREPALRIAGPKSLIPRP